MEWHETGESLKTLSGCGLTEASLSRHLKLRELSFRSLSRRTRRHLLDLGSHLVQALLEWLGATHHLKEGCALGRVVAVEGTLVEVCEPLVPSTTATTATSTTATSSTAAASATPTAPTATSVGVSTTTGHSKATTVDRLLYAATI
jgi:hypothetical protein